MYIAGTGNGAPIRGVTPVSEVLNREAPLIVYTHRYIHYHSQLIISIHITGF